MMQWIGVLGVVVFFSFFFFFELNPAIRFNLSSAEKNQPKRGFSLLSGLVYSVGLIIEVF
jgi:hypothetical protein